MGAVDFVLLCALCVSAAKKSRVYFTMSVKKLFKVCGGAPFREVVNDKV
jgi:hypothetical protein